MQDEFQTNWRPIHDALFVFLLAVSALVALVWLVWIFQASGSDSVFHRMGLALTSVFILAHPPSIAAGLILWRAKVARGWSDWFIKGATVYFIAATVLAFMGMYTMTSLVNGM